MVPDRVFGFSRKYNGRVRQITGVSVTDNRFGQITPFFVLRRADKQAMPDASLIVTENVV